VYDGVHMPFEANSFDTGLLLTVLHHCPDPDIVLQEAARVSQKLVIIEDVYSNPIQQYMTYAIDTLVNFGHSSMTYQNRSDKEWKTTFDRMGFKLVEESSKSVLLFFRQATYVLETSP
jgi:ubiquinone/menaquinone biosynthesis C-methylase UbiE